MIGIKVNGGFLQLAPDTSAEIERESPFFSIDQINTEYSNPINFLYTKENCRLLGMKYHYYVERQKTTVEADIYSGTTYKGRGTLIVESGKLNLTNVEDTILTGYVLFGISRFFQVIRDKKLTDLSLGGTRSFNWTTSNPYDGSGGYWQHFHSTWTDNTIPYVFAPVRNEAYYGDQSDIDWMNKPAADGSLALDYTTPIVPMIRLEYLLRCIFQENGFTVDFSRIPDQHWKKIILINPVKLEWTRVGPINTGGRITYGPTAAPQVKINLTKHLPQKQTISDFLIQLFYRFGWAPIFTGNNCSFIPVKVLPTSTRKDWSAYASPEADTSFNAEKKIYAFKNDINGNDSAPERPDMEGITIYRNVGYQRDLPTAGSDNVEKIAYCYYENHYYKSTYEQDTNSYSWDIYGDNIFDSEPEGNTDTITTQISPLAEALTSVRVWDGIEYFATFPLMKAEARKEFGLRIMFFHGFQTEQASNGAPGSRNFALTTALGWNNYATNDWHWSLPWEQPLFKGTPQAIENGSREYWWSSFLKILQSQEIETFYLSLPLHILENFSWSDTIIINQIPYLVMNYTEKIPYTGQIQATLKRIVKAAQELATATPGQTDLVYAKLTTENIHNNRSIGGVIFDIFATYVCDVRITFWKDANATIPYTPTETMYVYVMWHYENLAPVENQTPSFTRSDYYIVDPSGYVLKETPYYISTIQDGKHYDQSTYTLDPSGAIGYTII